jgi:uncharacterized membrane protein YhiD involved in acid resistance
LTTAASIWVIAAVGVAVGCDRFLLATGAAVLMLIILHLLVKLEPPQRPPADETELKSAPSSAPPLNAAPAQIHG